VTSPASSTCYVSHTNKKNRYDLCRGYYQLGTWSSLDYQTLLMWYITLYLGGSISLISELLLFQQAKHLYSVWDKGTIGICSLRHAVAGAIPNCWEDSSLSLYPVPSNLFNIFTNTTYCVTHRPSMLEACCPVKTHLQLSVVTLPRWVTYIVKSATRSVWLLAR